MSIPDPRSDNARHDLLELLFIALLSTLYGARNCAEIEEFGLAKEPPLRQILTLEHGIPSHDTFSRIFRMLDPLAFEAAFGRFMAASGEGAKIKAPSGRLNFKKRLFRVGKAFHGQQVSIRPTPRDGSFDVCFGRHPIAAIDLADAT